MSIPTAPSPALPPRGQCFVLAALIVIVLLLLAMAGRGEKPKPTT